MFLLIQFMFYISTGFLSFLYAETISEMKNTQINKEVLIKVSRN